MSQQAQPFHQIENIRFESGSLILKVDGTTVRCELAKVAPDLLSATPEVLSNFEISPSGYGIHWPLLDYDLAIGPLLRAANSAA